MFERGVELLLSLGADKVKHPGGTLLTHLLRVEQLLIGWGASETIVKAGLLHALFAPDGSPDPYYSMLPVAERPRVVDLVGAVAEELVYTYGACDRDYVYPRLMDPIDQWRDRFTGLVRSPGREQLSGLMEITAANECDIASHNPGFRAQYGAELYQLFSYTRPLLSDAAWAHCRAVLGSVTPPRAPSPP